MKKNLQKIKKPAIFLLAGFFALAFASQKAEAAPDITVKNIAGSGSFQPGQPITFTYDITNQSDGMDTTNSYGFVVTGKYTPPANEQTAYFHNLDFRNGKAYLSAGWPFAPSAGTNTLSIFDISGAGDPIRMGRDLTLNPTSHGYSSILLDNYVYVVGQKDDSAGNSLGNYLRTYDISDPNNPVLKNEKSNAYGTYNGSAPDSIYAYSNYLYIETFQALQIWDVSNRANPVYIKDFAISNNNSSLNRDPIEGRYLYRANNYSATAQELEIYDLLNPTNPVKVGGFNFADGATAIAVSNNIAFVATYRSPNTALRILDISNRANPVELGSSAAFSGNGGKSILLRGNQAMIGGWGPSMLVFDVADIAAPKLLSKSQFNSSGVHEFGAVDNSKIYATEARDFEVFEPHVFSRVCVDNSNCLTDETGRLGSDVDAGLLAQNSSKSVNVTWASATLGDHTAYFCSDIKNKDVGYGSYDGVAESNESNNCQTIPFTIANPPKPDIISELSINGDFFKDETINFSGNVKNIGLAGMNTANSYGLVKLGGAALPDANMMDVATSGNLAYVVGGTSGNLENDINVFDISNPANPSLVGGYNSGLSDSFLRIVISDGYAYVGANSGASKLGLLIFDITTDPKNPKLISYSPTPGGVFDIIKKGNIVYASGGAVSGDDLVAFDVTNKNSPVKIAGKVATSGVGNLALSGDGKYLYYMDYQYLEIFDTTSGLTKVREITFPQNGFGIVRNGNYLYIGASNAGIRTMYIGSDPSNPSDLNVTPLSAAVSLKTGSLSVAGNYLYVSYKTSVEVFDINSNPAAPIRVNPGQAIATYYTGSNSISAKYVFTENSTGLPSATIHKFEIFEPHVFSRVCIDSAGGANGCLNNASGRIGTDFDMGSIAQNGVNTINVDWIATPGNHIAYFCSDVKNMSGYDGVAESDETNNCFSDPFTIADPMPINGQCNAAFTSNCHDELTDSSELCALGINQLFSGSGPWSWECRGLFSGSTVPCSATKCGIEWSDWREVEP